MRKHRLHHAHDLRGALRAAQGGDVIELEAGATFTGTYELPPHDGAAPVTITTAGTPIPPPGTRVTPDDAHAGA
jgi:hypothetical protein